MTYTIGSIKNMPVTEIKSALEQGLKLARWQAAEVGSQNSQNVVAQIQNALGHLEKFVVMAMLPTEAQAALRALANAYVSDETVASDREPIRWLAERLAAVVLSEEGR